MSQRELAARAQIPRSTIERAEAGRHAPSVATFVKLLGAAGYAIVLADRHGRLLTVDEEHDRIRDRVGRRFPAHLRWDGKPDYRDGPGWWGWHRIAWYVDGPAVPDHIFWRRRATPGLRNGLVPDEELGYLWDDAT